MTRVEKDLLVKDLCARLPYGVIVTDRNATHELSIGNTEFVDLFNGKCHIKPYLRPMSSITEEENRESMLLHEHEVFDYFNAHHLDYRGLIPMGLALEAPKDMYNIK